MDFQKLIASPAAAYQEGLDFFMGQGVLNNTIRHLVADLERNEIDYSVIDGVALNQHGYKRFTEDIDLVMSKEGLEHFRACLVGLGYRLAFNGAQKSFRTENNVKVEIIITGDYPGDGKPKPVQFPDPADDFCIIDGIKTVSLKKLVELKLASGMTSPGRLKDLADVQELIKVKNLDKEFAQDLSSYVKEKFLELYNDVEKGRGQDDRI
ncbi:MAG: hypothetical protein ACRD63_08895 [Pyrinomonadaceae bacterium]